MSEIRLDTTKFEKQLARFMAGSRRDLSDVMKQQMRLFVRDAATMTPPGKRGSTSTSGTSAKKKGEASVKSDISKLFAPVPKAQAESVDLAAVHKRQRNSRGRVGRVGDRRRVYSAELNAFIRKQVAKVGALAAGWNRAAARVGWKPPAWIWRHASPGSIDIEDNDKHIRLKARNRVRYASDQKGLERRLQMAMNARADALRRQVDRALEKNNPF
ncbi:MAG: hypothetical protein AAF236_00805 [Verrucomicrobiota bacterium]